jgi:hypothetical protein
MFPSGTWTGFYTYGVQNSRHRMDLVLAFQASRICGEGQDDIGPFVIDGTYDSGSGECYWTKTYVAAHDVFYRGFREQGRGIWGVWELETTTGGFHIWPVGEQPGETQQEEEADPVPQVAVAAAEN